MGTETIIGFVSVGVGLLIALIQFWFATKHEKFTNTLLIIDRLEDKSMLSIRHHVDDIMAEAKERGYDFNALTDEQRADLSSVSKLFGLVGVLARRKRIDTSIIYTGWARNITATYDRMTEYFEWRGSLPGGSALNNDFRWLAKRVRRFCR